MYDTNPHHVQHPTDAVREILLHGRRLVATEAALLKSEMSENLSRASHGLIACAIAVVLALVALHVLAFAAVLGVSALGLGLGWSALIVGGGALIVAALLAMFGARRLSAKALMPRKSFQQVRQDLSLVKEA